ncbi:MAG: hypothetical protein J0H22_02600, partial [Actinobacteria bacterium]|nr:hypothetical protein [Actinomycetota bacterium]
MAGGADRGGENDALTQAVAGIGTRLDARLTDITRSVAEQLVSAIAELRGEEQLQQVLDDSVTANIDAFFAAVRHGISIDLLHAPAAALEHARRLAQRDISANVLVRSYRLGHRTRRIHGMPDGDAFPADDTVDRQGETPAAPCSLAHF